GAESKQDKVHRTAAKFGFGARELPAPANDDLANTAVRVDAPLSRVLTSQLSSERVEEVPGLDRGDTHS
ncbi:MAG: hypothetical protein MRY32_04345, partial [Rickettsiales bacterium]|nr:hypothetical protein [Rickettsiales bacterium]